jgi:hypothetical protein
MVPCHLSNSASFKKNPFLGPELLWFANPNAPGGPTPPAAPAEPSVEEAPQKEGVVPLVDYLKEKVPGHHGDPEKLMERQEHWITLLGDYNGVQQQIDYWFGARAQLNDDKLFKLPVYRQRFKALVKPMYGEMLKTLQGKFGPKVERGAAKSIREQAMGELKADRANAIHDVDATIRALFEARKEELLKINEKLQEDMQERIKILKEKWEDKCPKGFEECQAGWVETCMDLLGKIQEQDLSTLDDGTKKEGAIGNELLKEYQIWWDQLDAMEDTYADFSRPFNEAEVEEEYKKLKSKTDHLLTDAAIKTLQENTDHVLRASRETIPIIKAKIAAWKGDDTKKQDVETLEKSLTDLEERMVGLEKTRDIKKLVDEMFTGTKEIGKFKLPNEEGFISIPEGIEGQIEVLKKTPFTTPGRRAVIRTLLDSMQSVGSTVQAYVEFGSVALPQALEDLRLFGEGIDPNSKKVVREIMFINPFAAAGQIWESYKTAVKGNVETNAKRGAAYLQKEIAKPLNHLSKIPGVRHLSVIKSAAEMSSNGATEAEHAEHHRISEFEKNYEKYPPDHLLHTAMEAGDQWELKACLSLLAKHGRIDWCAPWLAKKLNSYQKTIKIPEDRHYHQRNTSKSRELFRQAFVYIYRDEDSYKSLRNTNLSSYESKMSEFSKDWGGIASEDGALEKEAQTILDLYKADHDAGNHASKADPIKFESIIRYATEWGKMKMEARLKLLVQGIAIGLLPFERGVNSTDKNNNYPPYDYFDSSTVRGKKPTYDDVLEWNVYAKTPASWDYFMHKSDGVMNNKTVNERFIKTMTGGGFKMDHDDAAGVGGYLTMNIAKDLLTQRTQGGFLMPATGLLSISTGQEMWLRMYAEEFSKRSVEANKLEMIRFGSSFFMYEGILNRRVFKDKQNYFRLEPSDAAVPPRFSRGGYNNPDDLNKNLFQVKNMNVNAGVGEIISDVAHMLIKLDFTEDPSMHLLSKLVKNEIKTDDDAKLICEKLERETKMFEGSPPQNIDALYDALPKYIGYAIEKHPEQLDAMVKMITSQHGRHTYEMDHGLEHELEHVRAGVTHRGLTGEEPKHEKQKGGDGGHGGGHGGDAPHKGDHPAEEGGHEEHPAEGGDHGAHPAAGGAGAHGDDHGAAAAAHGGAVKGSTHGN